MKAVGANGSQCILTKENINQVFLHGSYLILFDLNNQ